MQPGLRDRPVRWWAPPLTLATPGSNPTNGRPLPVFGSGIAPLGWSRGAIGAHLRGNSVGTPGRLCRSTGTGFANLLYLTKKKLVGAAGFEPTTPSPPEWRSIPGKRG